MAQCHRADKVAVSQRMPVSVPGILATAQPVESERSLKYQLESRNDPKTGATRADAPLSNFPLDKPRVRFGEDRWGKTL